MMTLRLLLIGIGLVERLLARSIPEYYLCIEACGEDPHENNVADWSEVELCRDGCNKEERVRCVAKNQHNDSEKRNCWKLALHRCIGMCQLLHTPPPNMPKF
ncbi:hypothetical protein CRM22_006711 [Opisthorchis felineus]|uniref:Uncharacterized protein n=1 Tax=Opisthorchis felineus TaxID=147828 RepID=A0A4S2LRX8_OPIFE|nr:hypothetical protein CRM22_006711 [Opisthorchis felineus]